MHAELSTHTLSSINPVALRAGRPGVYAVGDCAAWWSPRFRRRLRVEHWDTALNAPDVVAANLLGGERAYDAVPYFWSEQFGRMVQYAGHHPVGDGTVRRGDPSTGTWAVCWLLGGRLVAVLTVDRPRDLLQGRRAIAGGAEVGEAVDDDEVLDAERAAELEVGL